MTITEANTVSAPVAVPEQAHSREDFRCPVSGEVCAFGGYCAVTKTEQDAGNPHQSEDMEAYLAGLPSVVSRILTGEFCSRKKALALYELQANLPLQADGVQHAAAEALHGEMQTRAIHLLHDKVSQQPISA